jgi:hypothetical protein
MFSYPSFLVYLFLIGCASPKTTTTTSRTTTTQPGKYTEDLSVWRPKTENTVVDTSKVAQQGDGRKQTAYVEPKYAVTKQLDEVLDSINSINLTQKHVEGFTIQVYSGAKREEALSIKRQLSTSFPEIDTDVQFIQPNFRVKAGKYFDRLDAQKDYLAVRRYFPNAILIPDRIAIN